IVAVVTTERHDIGNALREICARRQKTAGETAASLRGEGNREGEAAEGGREIHQLVALALDAVAGAERADLANAQGSTRGEGREGDLVAPRGEADIAIGFIRAVEPEVRGHIAGIADAVGE